MGKVQKKPPALNTKANVLMKKPSMKKPWQTLLVASQQLSVGKPADLLAKPAASEEVSGKHAEEEKLNSDEETLILGEYVLSTPSHSPTPSYHISVDNDGHRRVSLLYRQEPWADSAELSGQS